MRGRPQRYSVFSLPTGADTNKKTDIMSDIAIIVWSFVFSHVSIGLYVLYKQINPDSDPVWGWVPGLTLIFVFCLLLTTA